MNPLDKILPAAKAWAALVGAVLTALVGTLTPDDAGYRVLTGALAVVTALAVYRVSNADAPDESGAGELRLIVVIAAGILLGVFALWLIRK